MNIVLKHIESVLAEYTNGKYYQHLLNAKDKYFKLTGKLNEDAAEFESRMNSFNDWYVFNYDIGEGRRIIDDYIQDKKIEEDLAKGLYNVNYSLFHFVKINWKGQVVLNDILHDQKIVLGKDNETVALVPDDLFIGRVIQYKDQSYLMKGVCALPREVLGILKKKSKAIRKLSNDQEELDFLIGLENLKTKSLNYSHISADKIFNGA